MPTSKDTKKEGGQSSPGGPHTIVGSLLNCLIDLTKFYERKMNASALISGLPLTDETLSVDFFERAAERAQFKSKIARIDFAEIKPSLLPCVILLKGEQACLLTKVEDDNFARIQADSEERLIALSDLEAQYVGAIILVKPKSDLDSEETQKDSRFNAMKAPWFWNVVRQSWPLYGEVLLASFFINLLALASPLFVMNVYDRVVPNTALETLWMLAAGVFIAFSFDFIMRMLRTHFVDNTARNIDARLSAKIFERVMGIRMTSRPKSVGGLANTVQAFESFRDFMTSVSTTILIDFPFTLLFIFFIGLIGGSLFLVPLILMPVVLGISLLVQAPLIKLVQKSYELAGAKQQTLIETLVGISTVKTRNAQGSLQRKWEQLVCYAAQIGMKLRFLTSFAVNLSMFSQYMGSVMIVIVGVYKIANNELTIGALIACTILTGRALAPLVQIASLLMRYYQSMTSIKGLDDMMNLPVERPVDKKFIRRESITNDIEFKKLDFNYPEAPNKALEKITFKINPEERVAVIGRVGSGKSTMLKLAVGLYEPSHGKVFVSETDIQQLDPIDIRRHMGYVPQDIILFSGSIRDNIVLGDPNASDDAILKAAQFAGLGQLISDHPDGINMQVGERGEMLSGGQRQAVAIAQAMLHNPSLLIFDEPTNSMDEMSEANFRGIMEKSIKGKTLVLATHKASMLALADRIIILDGGRIVADGPKDTVLKALQERRVKAQKETKK